MFGFLKKWRPKSTGAFTAEIEIAPGHWLEYRFKTSAEREAYYQGIIDGNERTMASLKRAGVLPQAYSMVDMPSRPAKLT